MQVVGVDRPRPKNFPLKEFVTQLKEHLEVERLRPKVIEAAKRAIDGGIILIPSDGVYNLSTNGNKKQSVERSGEIKGRDSNQKEGIIQPPKKLRKIIDLQALSELNGLEFDTVERLYRANQVGLVVPCIKEKVPSHLITYHEVGGQKIPTVLNVWSSKCRVWQMLDSEFSRDPQMLWVGTSANFRNQSSITDFETAFATFGHLVDASIKDPREHRHQFVGSYTIINLVTPKPHVWRIGSVHPKRHPDAFKKFLSVLPELIISR